MEELNQEHDWKTEEKPKLEVENSDLKRFVFKIGMVFTLIQVIWFAILYLLII